jgi:hypothetical protein
VLCRWFRKRFSIRSRSKSSSAATKEDSVKPKVPPPRPPPPSGSVSKPQLEAAVSSQDQRPALEFGMFLLGYV